MAPDGFCLVIDTREQLPYSWPGIPTVRKALPLGDYSVLGLENRIGVERKSHADFVATVTTRHRQFFDRLTFVAARCSVYPIIEEHPPAVRLAGFGRIIPYYAIVVEASAAALDAPMPWTRVTPATVHANLIKLAALGVPVWPAGTRVRAAAWTLAFLRRAWEEIRGLHR